MMLVLILASHAHDPLLHTRPNSSTWQPGPQLYQSSQFTPAKQQGGPPTASDVPPEPTTNTHDIFGKCIDDPTVAYADTLAACSLRPLDHAHLSELIEAGGLSRDDVTGPTLCQLISDNWEQLWEDNLSEIHYDTQHIINGHAPPDGLSALAQHNTQFAHAVAMANQLDHDFTKYELATAISDYYDDLERLIDFTSAHTGPLVTTTSTNRVTTAAAALLLGRVTGQNARTSALGAILSAASADGAPKKAWFHGTAFPDGTVAVYDSFNDYEHFKSRLLRYKKFRDPHHAAVYAIYGIDLNVSPSHPLPGPVPLLPPMTPTSVAPSLVFQTSHHPPPTPPLS